MKSRAAGKAFGSASQSRTSCPARAKLMAQARPTKPEPIIAVFIRFLPELRFTQL